MLEKFLRNAAAATSIEYCLIAGLISIVIVVGATQIGVNINTKFYGPLLAGFN